MIERHLHGMLQCYVALHRSMLHEKMCPVAWVKVQLMHHGHACIPSAPLSRTEAFTVTLLLCPLSHAGRAGLSQVADSFVADPRQLYAEGQSVRAQVVTADVAHGRFSVTLRPSLTASQDASFLAALLRCAASGQL